MPLQPYIVDCPNCGCVEGYPASETVEQDTGTPNVEDLIEEREFSSWSGPVEKFRCPRCGAWLDADRVSPEE